MRRARSASLARRRQLVHAGATIVRSCETGVRIAASKVDGVKEVKIDSEKPTAGRDVESRKTIAQAVANAIRTTGFETNIPRSLKSKT